MTDRGVWELLLVRRPRAGASVHALAVGRVQRFHGRPDERRIYPPDYGGPAVTVCGVELEKGQGWDGVDPDDATAGVCVKCADVYARKQARIYELLPAIIRERLTQQVMKDGIDSLDASGRLSKLVEEVGEVARAMNDLTLRELETKNARAMIDAELAQVAAIAIGWMEDGTKGLS